MAWRARLPRQARRDRRCRRFVRRPHEQAHRKRGPARRDGRRRDSVCAVGNGHRRLKRGRGAAEGGGSRASRRSSREGGSLRWTEGERTFRRAGLLVFGSDYAWVGIARTASGREVVVATCLGAPDGCREEAVASLPAPAGPVQLRVQWLAGGRCRFAVSFDGRHFTDLGPGFAARAGRWVGAKVGLFATARAAHATRSPADFAWVRVAPLFAAEGEE